ncbi:MAG: hypothetical protein FJ026_16525, partial [Chloroflexi bacterium]|nr:hypothetical protein [Chloroflexota bacterium]
MDNTAIFYYRVNHGSAQLRRWALELPSGWDASKVKEIRYVTGQGCSSSKPTNWTSFLPQGSVNGSGPRWWVADNDGKTCDLTSRHLHIEGDIGSANTCTWFKIVFDGVWKEGTGWDYKISGSTCDGGTSINGPQNALQTCDCQVGVTLLNYNVDCTQGKTIATYKVQVGNQCQALSHWNLDICDSFTQSTIAGIRYRPCGGSWSNFTTYAVGTHTVLCSFPTKQLKMDVSISANQCYEFEITFNGVWQQGNIGWRSKHGTNCEPDAGPGTVGGPTCDPYPCACDVAVSLSGGGWICRNQYAILVANVSNDCDYPYTIKSYEWYKNGVLDHTTSLSTWNVNSSGTYSVTVKCLNEAGAVGCWASSNTQVVTLDDVPPQLSCPPQINVQCRADVPDRYANLEEFLAAGGMVSDNWGYHSYTFRLVKEETDGLSCPETISRTYEISDWCYNTA